MFPRPLQETSNLVRGSLAKRYLDKKRLRSPPVSVQRGMVPLFSDLQGSLSGNVVRGMTRLSISGFIKVIILAGWA